MHKPKHERIYFRQLLAGVDFGRAAPGAAQMENFVYVIGDTESGDALVVDPAWATKELVELVEADGMRLTGALVTHYHPDHIGGQIFGMSIDGLAELMQHSPCPVHVHRAESEGVLKVTGLSASDLTLHDSGDKVRVGEIEVELLHTPGHTPGSMCFRLGGALVSGDTLFLQGCGRVDLPGGDVDEMFRTLRDRLGALPGETMVFPGHAYGGRNAPIEELRSSNYALRVTDLMKFRQLMGS